MANTYNLFISHSWTYGDAYEKLVSMLDSRWHFWFKNYSVPKDDPIHNAPNDRLLYEAIERQINPTSCVIFMAWKYSTYSKWINKEIEIALNMWKPIVWVIPWANEQVSSSVQDAVKQSWWKLVGWNTESIIAAIREVSNQ